MMFRIRGQMQSSGAAHLKKQRKYSDKAVGPTQQSSNLGVTMLTGFAVYSAQMPSLLHTLGINFPGKRLIGERIRSLTAQINPEPLFLFGNQKSGTTAIAALLAIATAKSVTLDFQGAWGSFGCALIQGKTPIEEFVRLNSWAFSADIVKEPNLTFAAPRLLEYFGLPRAIFVVRNPLENIRSMLQRLKLRGDHAELSSAQMRRLNPTWQNILSGNDLGLPKDHYIAILAKRWTKAMETFGEMKDRLVLIRYEDFNDNKLETIQLLARTFQLDLVNDISSSLNHPYQPRAKAPADVREFFGKQNLRRIEETCADRMRDFGYTPL